MRGLLITAAIALGLSFVFSAKLDWVLYHQHLFHFQLFLIVISFMAHYIGQLGLKSFPQQAGYWAMAGMMLRLFTTLVAIGLYLVLFEQPSDQKVRATFLFFFFYFMYQFAEVGTFITNLRGISKS